MIRYLLHTNVISEVRKRRPHGAVVSWMESLRPEQIALSAATAGEIQDGIELARKSDPDKADEIEKWLTHVEQSFNFLPMNTVCFQEWSRMMMGKSDSITEDAMIAATAKINGLVVATRDEKDFKQFGVPIFNPFKPTRTQ